MQLLVQQFRGVDHEFAESLKIPFGILYINHRKQSLISIGVDIQKLPVLTLYNYSPRHLIGVLLLHWVKPHWRG